jgi:hypothetical protein
VIFQIALEQDNIKELFSLLKKIFNVFDTNANGTRLSFFNPSFPLSYQ